MCAAPLGPRIGSASKCHMLGEMGPALFMVLLVQRPGIDPNADRDLAGGKRVAPNRIADAVREGAEGPGRIGSDIAAAVEPAAIPLRRKSGRSEEKQEGEQAGAKKCHGKPS